MKRITKTPQKATYFEGTFYLRDEKQNWAYPIDFPTVFTAYGSAIRSGNWQSCTAINTPDYVIEHYFDEKEGVLKPFWAACRQLEPITWEDVRNDKERVLNLINVANNELLKLPEL